MPENVVSPNFRLEDFEYDLPEELVAQEPPAVRHASRLMHINRTTGEVGHHTFSSLADLLSPGDLLIVNDTKVIPARLMAARQTGAQVEILLLKPEPARPGVWLAMAAPLKKLKEGEHLLLQNASGGTVKVDAFVTAPDGQRRVLLDFGSQENVYKTLSEGGFAPLPPYILRQFEAETAVNRRSRDLERYQTIFAAAPGAVAAPTAGLHFSSEVFERLEQRGVEVGKITLHVGAGTFKPIETSLDEHTIESERYSITPEVATAINKALDEGRRVVAVGTTSCRALETAGATGRVEATKAAESALYIRPGFQFKIVGALVTNFHLSKSSLLVLVSSFAGHDLTMKAYKTAVAERYRFFSYGDAMLIT